jgi:excinuclease ABC subunit B
MKNQFQVISPFSPQGDQPQAIDKLTAALSSGANFQTLLGATGTDVEAVPFGSVEA